MNWQNGDMYKLWELRSVQSNGDDHTTLSRCVLAVESLKPFELLTN